MAEQLSEEQKKLISQTLKRIRGGLRRFTADQFSEPSHVFSPEWRHDSSK